MIVLKDIRKSVLSPHKRPISILNGINLEIKSGEVFGLIGPSGAGKSTLLRTMNLLVRPDSGSVWVRGKEFTSFNSKDLRSERRQIGMIFQQFSLLSNLSVAENIAFPLKILGKTRDQIKRRVEECLSLVQLSDKKDHYPAQLSGGQKQRVGIARALASNPYLLLADEPTSALDPSTRDEILHCLKEINENLGITIVLVTHDLNIVKSLCHRAAVIEQGKVKKIISDLDSSLQQEFSSASTVRVP
jgi:D-methionine transport system ATP-binding protein